MKKLLPVNVVCERLVCSKSHVYELCKRRELEVLITGKRKGYRITEQSLQAYMDRKIAEFQSLNE